MTASQKNWVDLLDTTQFCYNLYESSSKGMSPTKLALGQQPMIPLEAVK